MHSFVHSAHNSHVLLLLYSQSVRRHQGNQTYPVLLVIPHGYVGLMRMGRILPDCYLVDLDWVFLSEFIHMSHQLLLDHRYRIAVWNQIYHLLSSIVVGLRFRVVSKLTLFTDIDMRWRFVMLGNFVNVLLNFTYHFYRFILAGFVYAAVHFDSTFIIRVLFLSVVPITFMSYLLAIVHMFDFILFYQRAYGFVASHALLVFVGQLLLGWACR